MVRRRGLIRSAARTAGRTAVIAGTATAVSGRVASRQREREADVIAHRREPQAETGQAPPTGNDLVGRLHQLADLKAMGALTEKEFTEAKGRLLKE